MYAILDIETTGGKYNQESITEIAIYRFNGHEITDRFISLINPERRIHPFVVNLTGIDNHMLRNAPKFHEVAKRIVEITEGCILVAHNAPFDYRMLRTEFKRLGFYYERKILCTVELSQKLIPGKESYSLGKLARSLGIPVTNRHRAEGDARATTRLFKLLLAKDSTKTIIKEVVNGALTNPTWLNIVEDLPVKTGVYYVHNTQGDIVYIGSGKNIRSSVNQHFTGRSKLAKAIQKNVSSVTHEETGNTLIAALKVHWEIRKNQPAYNFPPYGKKPMPPAEAHTYPHKNMVIVDRGRTIAERSAILVEDNLFRGFGFFELNHQIKNIHILQSVITPMETSPEVKQIIISYISNKRLKIISF